MKHSEDGGRKGAEHPRDGSVEVGYLKVLRERFPRVEGLSLRLLMQHATFRELCEEYEACTEVLKRLSPSSEDEAMRSEYSALSLRLEGELLRYISEHGDKPLR